MMENLYKELKFAMDLREISSDKESVDKYIVNLKKRIRRLNRQGADNSDIIWTSECSGYTRVDFDGLFTEEEKAEYIESNWIFINSPYDCTGKIFTTYIKVFNMPSIDRSVAYFGFAIDC